MEDLVTNYGRVIFFFQAEDGIRDRSPSRGLGDVYKRQGIGGAFLMVPAMIYIIGMPVKLIPGTSLFVTVFISAVVTILHSFNYGTIDLFLVVPSVSYTHLTLPTTPYV